MVGGAAPMVPSGALVLSAAGICGAGWPASVWKVLKLKSYVLAHKNQCSGVYGVTHPTLPNDPTARPPKSALASPPVITDIGA